MSFISSESIFVEIRSTLLPHFVGEENVFEGRSLEERPSQIGFDVRFVAVATPAIGFEAFEGGFLGSPVLLGAESERRRGGRGRRQRGAFIGGLECRRSQLVTPKIEMKHVGRGGRRYALIRVVAANDEE